MDQGAAQAQAPTPAKELSIVLVNPKLPLVSQSIEVFKSKRSEPVIEVTNATEAGQVAAQGLPCVIVFSLVEDADIIECIKLCKTLSLERRDGIHRMIVVSVKENKKLRDSVINRGASDFVNSKMAPTGLVFKTSLLISQVQRHLDKMNDPAKIVMSGPSRGAAGGGMVIVKGPAFNMSDEVIAEDTWIINNTPPKKVGSRWAIEIEGPDADTGTWEQLPANESSDDRWAWHPVGEDGKPLPKEAKQNLWIFAGQRPSYDLESGKWKLIGNNPELFYQLGAKKGPSKFKLVEEKGIVFSQDTEPARDRIDRSNALGLKLRQERDKQSIKKPNIPGAAGKASGAVSVSQEAPSASNNYLNPSNQPLSPEYDSIDSIGTLRDTKKEVPLDRVPCDEFGHPEGDWEPVKQQGWAFVTPEMKTKGGSGIGKLAPFWMLDKKKNDSKPLFDKDSNSWLFEKSQMPRKADKFEDLPPAYQEHLKKAAQTHADLEAAKASTQEILKMESERTSAKYSNIRDVKSDKKYNPLNFFFKISELISSGLNSAELTSHMAINVRDFLVAESFVIIRPSNPGEKRAAQVVCSTTDRIKEGRVLDLEQLPFKDALVDLEPKSFDMATDLCVGTYPIVEGSAPTVSIGCVLLFYPKGYHADISKQHSFMKRVTTQLYRIFATKV